MFDPATTEGEVERAVLADLDAFITCLDELPMCDVEKATANALLAYGDANVELFSSWNDAGYEVRDLDDYFYRVDDVELIADGTEALVTYCTWGGTQLILPATDTSPEQIIDGEYTSDVQRTLVRNIGGVWLLTGNETLQQSVGSENNVCI